MGHCQMPRFVLCLFCTLRAVTGSHTVSTGNTSILGGTRYCSQGRRKSLGNKKATALLLVFNGPLGEGCGEACCFFLWERHPFPWESSLGSLAARGLLFDGFKAGRGCTWLLTSVHQKSPAVGAVWPHTALRGTRCTWPAAVRAAWGGLCGSRVCRLCRGSNAGCPLCQALPHYLNPACYQGGDVAFGSVQHFEGKESVRKAVCWCVCGGGGLWHVSFLKIDLFESEGYQGLTAIHWFTQQMP